MKKSGRALVLSVVIGAALAGCGSGSQASSGSSPQSSVGSSSSVVAPKDTDAAVALAANAKCHSVGGLPDGRCTPGAVNPDVSEATKIQTICKRGWTTSIRPNQTYTENLKRQGMRDYGFGDRLGNYEEDHLIPLELGGAPSDPKNLWPEPHYTKTGGNQVGSYTKDKFENYLKGQVCGGKLPLNVAQDQIAHDWVGNASKAGIK